MERDTSPPRVLVLVRAGCHLCVDAVEIVSRVCAEVGSSWTTRDVDDDPELRVQFTDHVPVTFVDGRQLSLWFVDEAGLRAALTSSS